MTNLPESIDDMMASQRPGPLMVALGEVDKLHDLFHYHETTYKSSSEDVFSEEDCLSSQWCSKQEELVGCLLKMKNLMEEAELESMRLKEEKKLLTKRIGESLVTVNTEMESLRQQLRDQDLKLKELGATPMPYSSHDVGKSNEYTSGISVLVAEQTEQIISLQKRLLAYEQENSELRKHIFTGKTRDDPACENCKRLREYAGSLEIKLQKHKDSFTAMRKERKELKSEKLELLDQLKQLYGTLEDKEKELRDFILNYEQRMRDSEETIKALLAEKKRVDQERWNFLQRATASSERCITLKTELDSAEEHLKQKDNELRMKEEELQRASRGNTKEESIVEFFGLFGKQTSPSPKEFVSSESEEMTTSRSITQDAEIFQFDKQNVQLMQQNLRKSNIDGLVVDANLEQDDPILACSTPVPSFADTQYLSLGTPDIIRSESSPREPAHRISVSHDDGRQRIDERAAFIESPHHETETNQPSSVVRRASSFKRKDAPRRLQSPKHERHKNLESPKSPRDLEKGSSSSLTNGSVVRRQNSMSKRPRTFHPDLFDSIESTVAPLSPTELLQPPKSPRRKTLAGTFSRMFGKEKDKESSGSKSPEEEMVDKWKIWDSIQRIPMPLWKARDVIVWLEVECCMPMYAKSCSKNVKSGKVLLQLSEPDLANILGITNPMHRLKLKLALDNHRYPDRRNNKVAKLDHMWVAFSWLKDIGLAQYSEIFEKNLVDGRMLNTFAKKDLEKHFSLTKKFHQVSFMCALQLLSKMNCDKEALNLRRANCADANIDVLVWTNERLINWAHSIDLKEHAENLRDTGVHGALIVYEDTFTIDTMAMALGITIGKNALYKHLVSEFSPLLKAARSKLKPEDRLKNGKPKGSGLSRSFSLRWSRRERSKRLPASRSTGNINGNQAASKESNVGEENPVKRKDSRQATLL